MRRNYKDPEELDEIFREAEESIRWSDLDDEDFDLGQGTEPEYEEYDEFEEYEEYEEPVRPAIKAYNADFSRAREARPKKPVRREPPRQPKPAPVRREPEPEEEERPMKKRRGCLSRLLVPVLILALLGWGLSRLVHPPKTDVPIGPRKFDSASILLCGTDVSGDRTDTMMLLHIEGRSVRLLTLPRDTLTHATSGKNAKLNSAFGRNGCGTEGAEAMLDYVQDIIGYRPDGYLVVDLKIVGDIIELMGGVDFEVPKDMHFSDKDMDIDANLKAGLQHLDAEDALGLLRFRYGYWNQDLGRQDVQKDFLKACARQWLRLDNIGSLRQMLDLFSQRSLSTLDRANYLWIAGHILLSGGKIQTDTLPGTPDYIGGQSFYVLDREKVASMIDKDYNPYRQTIRADDLTIVEE